MRIAIFSDNFYPELSGIADSIMTTAKELGRRGHTIKFFVPRYAARNYRTANFPVEEVQLGENVFIHRLTSLPFPGPNKQSRMVTPLGLNTLRVRKFNPDLIHTHLFFGVGLRAVTAAKILRVPLVGTSHTPVEEFVRYSPIKFEWFKRLSSRYVSWYYNRCNFVSAPSGSIIREMRKTGFHRPSGVISNPIDLQSFIPPSLAQKRKLKKKFKLSENVVLYTGRLAPEKNIDVTIRAIAIVKKTFPNINFVITGHGGARESLEKLAKELGVDKEVKFFGTVHKEKFTEIYQAADIFAIASTAETQCISMMQGMAVGIPVVGVDWLGLGDYISDQNGIKIKVGDFEAMSKKILFLFKNSKKRNELGQGGLSTVKKFSIPKIADEWEKVYEKVAKKS